MTAALRLPPDNVPTLTEVVGPSELAATTVVLVDELIDAERLTGQILGHVQQQIDQVLAELVQGLVEGLVRDLHETLALTLHDTVREAVAQALARPHERAVHPGPRSHVD